MLVQYRASLTSFRESGRDSKLISPWVVPDPKDQCSAQFSKKAQQAPLFVVAQPSSFYRCLRLLSCLGEYPTMRFARIVPVVTLAARVTAQATFEPQDFNVTAALEDIGVDVSTLPEPEPEHETPGRRKRFSGTPCSLAVS